jgi:ABC-type glutathione transport system ATPase component
MESNLDSNSQSDSGTNPAAQVSGNNLLCVRGLSKGYVRGGLWHKRVPVAAVSSVSFEIPRGKTLALVGESGSGKSTVARCVTGLEMPDAGQILMDGADVSSLDSRDLASFRTRTQMVFQDAGTAMNPRFTALEVIEEPLLIQGNTGAQAHNQQLRRAARRDTRRDVVRGLMEEVGIPSDWMHRSILHFSGGQRQRLALARALALRPQFIVLDEALSGLDLSTQAQIANLLLDLQARYSLTYLLISHDLALVARLADTIGVMSGGRLVELGLAQEIISKPNHAETKKLLASTNAAATRLAAITGATTGQSA